MGGTGGANSSAPNRGRIGALLGVVEKGLGGVGPYQTSKTFSCQAMSPKIVFLAFSRHFQAPLTFWRRQNLVLSRFQTLFQAPQMELFGLLPGPPQPPKMGFIWPFARPRPVPHFGRVRAGKPNRGRIGGLGRQRDRETRERERERKRATESEREREKDNNHFGSSTAPLLGDLFHLLASGGDRRLT